MLKPWPSVLNDTIRSDSVSFQLLQDVEYHILATDSLAWLTHQANIDALGNSEPNLSRYKSHGNIGSAQPNSKTSHSAGGARMRVRSDHNHTWLRSLAIKFGVHNRILRGKLDSFQHETSVAHVHPLVLRHLEHLLSFFGRFD